ncbi:MAG TPA: hypothetical protein VFN67_27055 [Polyangiales bacterium]|nr:hypothetical protein [Polyangiales bacterium]
MNNYNADAKLLFLIDRIEDSSYPVTETGYALMYRAWMRALSGSGEIYVAYPDSPWTLSRQGELIISAHRVVAFPAAPYAFYRSQREAYAADTDVGSERCHVELEARALVANTCDAVVWRQETGAPEASRALLQALTRVERDTLVYLSPWLALDPLFASKVLPRRVDARLTPRTYLTTDEPSTSGDAKAEAARAFVLESLGVPETVIAKPVYGNNGVGIHVLGRHPITGETHMRLGDLDSYQKLLAQYGELVIQEYIPSVRSPVGQDPAVLAGVPRERCDFGEVRFLLIDGEVPRDHEGRPCLVARRVPTDQSLVADSGISFATQLSAAELAFLEQLGPLYRSWGIFFGGGDLIRTPDPERPFVFTDAARSVCGHAVVTGALNGEPYLIVDQVLDSIDRHMRAGRALSRTHSAVRV